MKHFILFFLLLLPLFPQAQEIKSNITDGFTNERTIETSIVTLKQGFSTGFGISYTAINTSYYLNVIGYGKGSTIISENDSIWFVLNNGVIAKLNSGVTLSNNESAYQNMYLNHYYISLNMVEAFKDHLITMVRIVSGDEHTDISISKTNSKSFAKLSNIFLKEVSK